MQVQTNTKSQAEFKTFCFTWLCYHEFWQGKQNHALSENYKSQWSLKIGLWGFDMYKWVVVLYCFQEKNEVVWDTTHKKPISSYRFDIWTV